jgi:hypothetical protein
MPGIFQLQCQPGAMLQRHCRFQLNRLIISFLQANDNCFPPACRGVASKKRYGALEFSGETATLSEATPAGAAFPPGPC